MLVVCAIETPAHDLHGGPGEGLWRKRQCPLPDHAQSGAFGIQAIDFVEQDIGRKSAGANAQTGKAGSIGYPASAGLAKESAESGRGVDGASPLMGKVDAGQLGECREKMAG